MSTEEQKRYAKEYYKKNVDKIRHRQRLSSEHAKYMYKKWYKENRERILESRKKQYQENKNKRREQAKIRRNRMPNFNIELTQEEIDVFEAIENGDDDVVISINVKNLKNIGE